MPATTTPPADGQQGDPTEGNPPSGGTPPQGGAGTPNPEAPKTLTLTQEQLDAIISERALRETRTKFADYDELKAKAAEFDKAKEAEKTELEKAQAAREKAEAKAKEAEARANATLVRAAIMTEAATQGAVDPEVVTALLAGDATITVENDTVKGAKEAVKALLKDKPYLVKAATPGRSGGEFGGNDGKTLEEKIREAEAKGDWKTARQLKTAGMFAGR